MLAPSHHLVLSSTTTAASPWGEHEPPLQGGADDGVLAMLADQGLRPVMAAQSRTWIEGKTDSMKHPLRFRRDNDLGRGPQELPELVVKNSYV